MYKLLRPILFQFDPEQIHYSTFSFLKLICRIPGVSSLLKALFVVEDRLLEKELMGLTFKNPVGLAAGFDKDAKLIDELSCFGFGCIEIGTLTPVPQPGNDKPRLFRLAEDQAIINRMGFNNGGAISAAALLKERTSGVLIGGNIGKNKITENEHAADDYRRCVEALHPYVDYFVVNVSSPNTPGLRELQEREPLKKLLTAVKAQCRQLPVPRPVVLKIAPDLTGNQIDDVIGILRETGTDGVIATNTTILRGGLKTPDEKISSIGMGGLSGKPLNERSNAVIAHLRRGLGPEFPIIGVGGIMTPEDALAKIKAGADLIQLYTGFIYEGPGIVKRINRHLLANLRASR